MKKLSVDIKSKSFWINLIVRIVLLGFALVLVYLYYAPLRMKILNSGNAFGLGIALILALLAVFWTRFCNTIKRIWKKKKGKKFLVTISAILLIGVTVFTSTLISIVNSSDYSATNETTVIVLGCRIWGSTPSRALRARVDVAVDYMQKNQDAVAILSGGQGSDENLSEAQCMYNLMTQAGIDASRIYLEDQSTSTDENIAFSKKIIEDNNLSTNVAVATTDYHQKRSAMICKKNDLTASSLPSLSGKGTRATFFTREVFGVWAQWVKLAFNK